MTLVQGLDTHLFRRGGEQHVVGGLDDVVLGIRVFSLRLVREDLFLKVQEKEGK